MNYEKGHQDQGQPNQWDGLKQVPFSGDVDENPFREVKRERTPAEESPLEDSRHYWAPEMYPDFDERLARQDERQARQSEQSARRDGRPAERGDRLDDTAKFSRETEKSYEQPLDAKSRAKVINYLEWRALQPSLDDADRQVRDGLTRVIEDSDPVTGGAAAEEAILYDIRDGVFGRSDERYFLERIAKPSMQKGEQATFESLTTRHERRFLANFSSAGFERYNDLSKDNLQEFLQVYPTPLDFEDSAKHFVEGIAIRNGDKKGQEYRAALESFMNKVYGKQYKYHKQFEALREEADRLPDDYEAMGENLPKGIGTAGIARRAVKAIRDFVIQNAPGLSGRDYAIKMREETLKYRGEEAKTSQDSILINRERGVYGIFDGAGGYAGGQAASRLASRVANSFAKRYALGDGKQLADVLTLTGAKLVQAERNGRKIGVTTGALAQIVDQGEGTRKLAYASVGDSRIYIVHADGSAEQMTHDEGYENVIENYLGRGQGRVHDDAGIMRRDTNTGRTENVTQYGERGLIRGDRVVICSDGITGDKGTDLMSAEELGYYVSASETAQDAAENLLGYARKVDDRSVVVVDAYPPKSSVVDGFLKRFFKK